jgi:hypothetical protein
VKTLSQVKATGIEGVLVAFGRQDDVPASTWCMVFDAASIVTIARTGMEVVFTAREAVAPVFNPDAFWVVTLIATDEGAAERVEARLRKLEPAQFFIGPEVTGIIVQCGHSLQSIGVPEPKLEALARQRGLKLTLVSTKSSAHRDYYAVSV